MFVMWGKETGPRRRTKTIKETALPGSLNYFMRTPSRQRSTVAALSSRTFFTLLRIRMSAFHCPPSVFASYLPPPPPAPALPPASCLLSTVSRTLHPKRLPQPLLRTIVRVKMSDAQHLPILTNASSRLPANQRARGIEERHCH